MACLALRLPLILKKSGRYCVDNAQLSFMTFQGSLIKALFRHLYCKSFIYLFTYLFIYDCINLLICLIKLLSFKLLVVPCWISQSHESILRSLRVAYLSSYACS